MVKEEDQPSPQGQSKDQPPPPKQEAPRGQPQYQQQPNRRKPEKPFYKKVAFIGLIVALIIIASIGTVWFLTRDGTSNGGEETYHGDASEYLLTEDEIGDDWTKNKTREPNFEPVGMETGRVINFDRNGDNLTVVVMVLESIEDAENLIDDQRDTFQSYSELAEQDLGDDSFSFSWFGTNYLNIRLSNVYIQIYGDSPLNLIKGYGQQQVEEIEG